MYTIVNRPGVKVSSTIPKSTSRRLREMIGMVHQEIQWELNRLAKEMVNQIKDDIKSGKVQPRPALGTILTRMLGKKNGMSPTRNKSSSRASLWHSGAFARSFIVEKITNDKLMIHPNATIPVAYSGAKSKILNMDELGESHAKGGKRTQRVSRAMMRYVHWLYRKAGKSKSKAFKNVRRSFKSMPGSGFGSKSKDKGRFRTFMLPPRSPASNAFTKASGVLQSRTDRALKQAVSRALKG